MRGGMAAEERTPVDVAVGVLIDGSGNFLLTSRPGRIAEEYPISIPRPRRLDSPEVAELAAGITDRLKDEVRRHGR